MNGYHDQWEPPRGGWGLLAVILIVGWALIFWAIDTIKELLQ